MIHRRAMLESYAWRSLNMAARRVLDFLEIEHLAHGGQENGNLAATYRQLADTGISTRDVPTAIEMLKRFGFLVRVDGGSRLGGRMSMARYRLTYLPDRETGVPTDDWQKITLADVKAFRDNPKPLAD